MAAPAPEANLQDIGSSPSTHHESSDDDFSLPTAILDSNNSKKKLEKPPPIFTSSVVATLDRVNVSDRQAMFIVGSVAKALGTELDNVPLSRSTIRRKRNEKRETIAELDKASFCPLFPLVLHWDGKLLPDIVSGVEKVDRVAIIVSGGGHEKLLAVPAITKGTAKNKLHLA